jgi:hypothetical protein
MEKKFPGLWKENTLPWNRSRILGYGTKVVLHTLTLRWSNQVLASIEYVCRFL